MRFVAKIRHSNFKQKYPMLKDARRSYENIMQGAQYESPPQCHQLIPERQALVSVVL